jgi:arabinofuranosyltransferase
MNLHRSVPWIVLCLAAAGLSVHAMQYNFISDDAYISFRYSYNFAFHNDLSFNLGQKVEGYTNFLWTLLLGLLMKLQIRPEVSAQVLGCLFGTMTLFCLYAITRIYRGGKRSGWDLLAVILLPATASFALWCSGGLETQMFTALATLGVTLYLAEHAGRVRWRLSGFVFALAAMTRPEGLLLFGLSGLHRVAANLIGEHRILPKKSEIAWALGFLLPFGLFFWWRFSYYGYPFPNTYYVKAGGDAWAVAKKWGFIYLWDFINLNKLYIAAPFALVFWPRVKNADTNTAETEAAGMRPAFVWSYVGLIVLTYTAYIVRVGGDFMAMGRFFVPLIPLIYFFIQECIREGVERFPRRPFSDTWRPWRMAATAILLLTLSIINSVGLYNTNQKLSYYRWGLDTIGYLKKFADDRIKVGNWLRKNLPKDTYLAVGGAGAIVYSSRFKALDTFGLNDAWIAHKTPRRGDRPGHGKSAPDHYIFNKEKPDLCCHRAKHQNHIFRPSPNEIRRWRAKGYAWVCIDPPGLKPRYYCCLKRIDKVLGPFPAEVGS